MLIVFCWKKNSPDTDLLCAEGSATPHLLYFFLGELNYWTKTTRKPLQKRSDGVPM